MAVPKKKTSVSRRNMRRSHLSLKKTLYFRDKVTDEITIGHRVDLKTGYHAKGTQVTVSKAIKKQMKQDDEKSSTETKS